MPIFEQYRCLQEWKLGIEKHRSVLEYLVPHWRRHRSATQRFRGTVDRPDYYTTEVG